MAGMGGAARRGLVTNAYGKGRTVFLGALLDREGWDVFLPRLLAHLHIPNGCPIRDDPSVEAYPDRGGWVVCNVDRHPVEVAVQGDFTDLIRGQAVSGALNLPGFGIAVLDPE